MLGIVWSIKHRILCPPRGSSVSAFSRSSASTPSWHSSIRTCFNGVSARIATRRFMRESSTTSTTGWAATRMAVRDECGLAAASIGRTISSPNCGPCGARESLASATSMENTTEEPLSGPSLSSSSVPPYCSTIVLATCSPMPLPPPSSRDACWYGRVAVASVAASMPIPSSITFTLKTNEAAPGGGGLRILLLITFSSSGMAGSRDTSTLTAPFGVNLMAFPMMLRTTRSSFSRSTKHIRPVWSPANVNFVPRSLAVACMICTAADRQ
mmetsp:Transcript_22403/g.32739  ORF Transcript_22403/g.32739 Transcript_22403/m.32739 type:complete len:269 (+) Transcript_22403:746-1552(+)